MRAHAAHQVLKLWRPHVVGPVLFFDANPSSLYGAQQSMLSLMQGLASLGIRTVLITTEHGRLVERAASSGLETEVIQAPSVVNAFGGKIARFRAPERMRFAFEVAKFGIRFRRRTAAYSSASAIVCNDARSLLLATTGVVRPRPPLIWYVRDDNRLGVLHALSLRIASLVLTVSDGVRNVFTERGSSGLGAKSSRCVRVSPRSTGGRC